MLMMQELAWPGVFARSARSYASSASVIFSVRYHLLLLSFNVKQFFLLDLSTFRVCSLGRLLYFDLLTRPKMPFKVMHQKEVTHSNGS